jgi:hypothetical protein
MSLNLEREREREGGGGGGCGVRNPISSCLIGHVK